MSGARTLVAVLAWIAGLAACLAAGAAPASAGTWMQVSCVNPDGTAAPSEGWTGYGQGSPGAFSYADPRCAPGQPMTAILGAGSASAIGSSQWLQYTPPAGSTLAGGTLNVTMAAPGYGQDASGKIDAVSVAALYEPAPVNSPGDLVYQCVAWLAPCPGHGSSDGQYYSGLVDLPSDRSGSLYLEAGCAAGDPGGQCDENALHGGWALAQVNVAHLLLRSNTSPQGTNFSGSALQRGARGTAHLVFTASDPGGPGVYEVAIAIDGHTVSTGTPNSNGGACVPVGTDPGTGALMFDHQQPCLQTETVDVPVPTGRLPDGPHQLRATVIDAAGNPASVRDQTIHTYNPQITPAARRGVRAQFVISWRWQHRRTTLRFMTVRRLPRNGRVTVRCLGRGCPKLKLTSAPARHVGRLLGSIRGRRFTAGDRLLITVTAPHRRAEHIELIIRDSRRPRARLIRR